MKKQFKSSIFFMVMAAIFIFASCSSPKTAWQPREHKSYKGYKGKSHKTSKLTKGTVMKRSSRRM